jgi:hypothetical protein
MKVDITATCDGMGYWSRRPFRRVHISKIDVTYIDDKKEFGELIATFDKGWNVKKDGLIYTDALWIKDFRNGLVAFGFSREAADNVEYSEQGMQSETYISMDVGKKFLDEWKTIHNSTRKGTKK